MILFFVRVLFRDADSVLEEDEPTLGLVVLAAIFVVVAEANTFASPLHSQVPFLVFSVWVHQYLSAFAVDYCFVVLTYRIHVIWQEFEVLAILYNSKVDVCTVLVFENF